jgi:hypothetical protein
MHPHPSPLQRGDVSFAAIRDLAAVRLVLAARGDVALALPPAAPARAAGAAASHEVAAAAPAAAAAAEPVGTAPTAPPLSPAGLAAALLACAARLCAQRAAFDASLEGVTLLRIGAAQRAQGSGAAAGVSAVEALTAAPPRREGGGEEGAMASLVAGAASRYLAALHPLPQGAVGIPTVVFALVEAVADAAAAAGEGGAPWDVDAPLISPAFPALVPLGGALAFLDDPRSSAAPEAPSLGGSVGLPFLEGEEAAVAPARGGRAVSPARGAADGEPADAHGSALRLARGRAAPTGVVIPLRAAMAR